MIVVTDDLQVIEADGCLTGRQVIAAVVFAGEEKVFDCVIRPRLIERGERHELEQCLREVLQRHLASKKHSSLTKPSDLVIYPLDEESVRELFERHGYALAAAIREFGRKRDVDGEKF